MAPLLKRVGEIPESADVGVAEGPPLTHVQRVEPIPDLPHLCVGGCRRLDGGPCSEVDMLLAFEGGIEAGLCLIDAAACSAPLERGGLGELSVGRTHAATGVLDIPARLLQRRPMGIEQAISFGAVPPCLCQTLGELRALSVEATFGPLQLSDGVADRGGELVEPLRYIAPRLWSRLRTRDGSGFNCEFAALGDGGQVGAVVGEDCVRGCRGLRRGRGMR